MVVMGFGWATVGQTMPLGPSPLLTSRLVVQFKDDASMPRAAPMHGAPPPVDRVRQRLLHMSKSVGVSLSYSHRLSDGSYVVELDRARSVSDAEELARVLAEQSDVQSVGVDVWVRPQAFIPNDMHFPEQWALHPRSYGVVGSARFSDAWDVSGSAFTGAASVVVALIDTGRVRHLDLETNEIDGYDFVSAGSIDGIDVAGDGDGRDADPSDPGDYCEASPFPSERVSSWHGLKMASIIAALAHNVQGISGAAPGVRVQQVRALGRCGGWLTDVADALRWAVGAAVDGVPANPVAHQVRVVNMSLGSAPGLDCNSSSYRYIRDAVRAAEAAGVVVVAAAGNEQSSSVGLPAGCNGVVAVGAHTSLGDLADYSNRSEKVTLTAPGGGCSAQLAGPCDATLIVALGNSGETAPAANLWRDETAGTSAATPFVSAAVALMLSLDDTLLPHQVRTILEQTARAHPPGSFCAVTPGVCGAGMLDAEAAVVRVRDGPIPGGAARSSGGALAWGWLALLGLAAGHARRLHTCRLRASGGFFSK